MSSVTLTWSAAWILMAAAAGVRLIRLASSAKPFVQNGYRWLAAAALCLGLGGTIQQILDGLANGPQPLWIADLVSFAALPALVIGLATIIAGRPGGDDGSTEPSRWRPYQTASGPRPSVGGALDGGLLAVSLLAIGMVVLFGPDYVSAGISPGAFALDLVQPVVDLATLGLILPLVPRNPRLVAAPALALAAVTLGDALAVSARAADSSPGVGSQLALVIGLALLACTPSIASDDNAGNRVAVLDASEPGSAWRSQLWRTWVRLAGPATAVLAALVICGYAVFGQISALPAVTAVATVVVILLVVKLAWFASRTLSVSESAQASDGVFRALADSTSDTVLICDLSGTIEYISHGGEFGYSRGAVPGMRLADIVHPEDFRAGVRAVMATMRGTSGTATFSGRVRSADGSWRQVSAALSRYDQPGGSARLLIACHDDSVVVGLRREVAQLTFNDGLTGLPNRAYLEDRVKDLAVVGARAGGAAAIMVALDAGATHDLSGQPAENLVLAQVGRRLRAVAPPRAVVGRWSSTEFAVLVEDGVEPEAADLGQVVELAERLAGSITAEPFSAMASELPLTARAGVAISLAGGCDQLLWHAHQALRDAAIADDGQVHVFSPDLEARARRRAKLGAALTQALNEHQLTIDYQPVVDLRADRVTYAEARPAWYLPAELQGRSGDADADLGELLRAADDIGLSGRLGEWMLRTACGQVAAWRAGGSEVGLAISCSARQVGTPGFAEVVLAALAEAELPAQALTLQVAEPVLAEAASGVAAELAGLRASGVRLAIDRFGTGGASLSYLRQLTVDTIRIDRSFIAGLGADPSLTLLTSAIVGLGRDLGIEVVACGVDRREQAELLVKLGCDLGQGDWLARRLPEQLPARAVNPDQAGDPACSPAS